MIYQSKKLICYTTSIALLTSSLSPVFAGKDYNRVDDDSSVETRHRPVLLFSEDSSQEKAKAPANGHTWAPEFVRDIASQAYKRVSSWFEREEDPFSSYDLSFLGVGGTEDFAEEIEDMKISGLDRRRLKGLQDMVWERNLSPYEYDKGLRELEHSDAEALLEGVRTKFQKKLRSAPASLNGAFQKDLLVFINHPCVRESRTEDMTPYTLPSIEEFEGLLTYYRGIQNPLDYTETLVGLNRLLQREGKSLNLTDQQSRDFRRTITTAIHKRDQKQYSHLRAQQRFIQAGFQELPFNGEEIPEGFNSSLPSVSPLTAEEAIQEEERAEPFSFTSALKGLTHAAYKGAKYAVEHPAQTITAGLALQASAVAALNKRGMGSEFQINQNTGGLQYWPSVASLTNGNAFVAWNGDQTGSLDVYGRIFSASGTPLTNEFGINQVTSSTQQLPIVAGLTNGNAFTVWEGRQSGGDIYGRIFSETGTALTSEFSINQVIAASQYTPSVAALTGGNAFVTWCGDQTGNGDIYGRIFFPNGTPLTNEFGINQVISSRQQFPIVAGLQNGNAFVVWFGDQTGNPDIYGRIFSATGTALTSEFSINQVIAGSQFAPSVAALTGGNAFVTWCGDQTGNTDVYGRLFFANGTALSNEISINTVTASFHDLPSITGLSNGNAFVAWYGEQTGNPDIYGRVFSATGTALTSEFSINTVTASEQYDPSVAGLTNGDAFTVWEGRQTGNGDIYGRVFYSPTTSTTSTTTSESSTSTTVNPTTSTVSSTTSSTTGPTTSTPQESTSSSTTGAVLSSAHKLTPSWFLSCADAG